MSGVAVDRMVLEHARDALVAAHCALSVHAKGRAVPLDVADDAARKTLTAFTALTAALTANTKRTGQ